MESCVSVRSRGKILKVYIERIMNEENDMDHNVEGDAEEGPVECECKDVVVQALNE